jgi:hypothetical protein
LLRNVFLWKSWKRCFSIMKTSHRNTASPYPFFLNHCFLRYSNSRGNNWVSVHHVV